VSFSQQTFATRHGQMGDESEAVFDELHADRVHRLGLNRYWANGKRLTLTQMSTPMRYAPDRMVGDRFVECMGIGRDQTLKIKDEKIVALLRWSMLGPTDLFVWDSSKRRWWQAPIELWRAAAAEHGEVKTFPEGKLFWAIHAKHFPSNPTELDA
jgi:hypothetical protein